MKEYIVQAIEQETIDSFDAHNAPELIRCKDCEWRGNKKKCILAFVADKQEFPLFFYDQRGEWFCADGKRKDGDGDDP